MSQEPGRISQFEVDHYVTGSLRRIYEFHGFPISEYLYQVQPKQGGLLCLPVKASRG